MTFLDALFGLHGQTAVVTGAGKGIGKACALALAQAGADVTLVARTESDLLRVADEIRALGRRAITVAGDISDEAIMDRVIARTTEEWGRLNILVNNVGGSGPNHPLKTSSEQLNATLIWNVTPAFLMIQKAAPAMRASGSGAVINISSVAARYAQKHFSAYGAAKAALNQLTRNLAQDLGPDIRINAIEPGTIMTDALLPFLTDERKERMLKTTPLARLGQPEDIAAAVVYLASAASSWVTGKIIGVDGGVESPNF
ncbi:MAG: glucose 1-dehydrogenase [Gammaproteobacteria bacterium]|nr:glucose 1-dehydrogenase [Gammaproteobacteria bacterium]